MAFKTEFVPGDNDLRDLIFRPADPTRARTLSYEQVEMFNRDGFVSPLPAFSPHEIFDLKHYVDDLIDKVVFAPDRRNSYSVTSYHLVCERLYVLQHERFGRRQAQGCGSGILRA